ncbi:MaoC/PaaZ C-terminal domain-containing protein [Prolixibacteraceae bacterium Z1-6]|uniref:MaoC/PaaZ C-terminal domain-containing protein n=1 Tax=Draconibacterium aestuarii TaxID=2998507 RepID=A0A9X3F536_9BACT|nr:MaoC/PaaZ C-terminal domain-containing protein [Prolixibacteraceae bacterium Z1-6]
MKEEDKFYEDFEIGESYMTAGRTITETDIVIHAMHSGDWQPHHTDEEFAKSQPIKHRIAHGNLTFCVSTGLIFQAEKPNPNIMAYGYNKIRYPASVYAGDTIKTEVKITDKKPHPKHKTHGLLTQTETTTNQRGETVAFVEHILYAKRRNPGE